MRQTYKRIKSNPKFRISGSAFTTVSISDLKPFAILKILSILITKRILKVLIMVGFNIVLLLNNSKSMPNIERRQIKKSN